MEVHTPLLASATSSDPHLASICLKYAESTRYLQTSPEQHMKRLLCGGLGDVYSLAPVFRADEQGDRHNPEFTMLEWYRADYAFGELIDECCALISACAGKQIEFSRASYAELWQRQIGLCPHRLSREQLIALFDPPVPDADVASLRELIFARHIEPDLQQPCIVYDFPADTAAMAQIAMRRMADGQSVPVAVRFEIYWRGLELLNGYKEVLSASEMRQRHAQDSQIRQRLGLPHVPPLELLYKALEHGMPPCCGAALGLERLLMCLLKTDKIADVLPFPADRA